jgi:hypothetical protein
MAATSVPSIMRFRIIVAMVLLLSAMCYCRLFIGDL